MAIRIAALFLLVLASFASSDEVTLKDGRVLEGEIIEENDKTLKLLVEKAKAEQAKQAWEKSK